MATGTLRQVRVWTPGHETQRAGAKGHGVGCMLSTHREAGISSSAGFRPFSGKLSQVRDWGTQLSKCCRAGAGGHIRFQAEQLQVIGS